MELAYDYLGEAALMDLHDLEHNVADGVHIASLAGAWIAIVAGLGGMRDHGGELSFAPRLPAALTRLAFRITFQRRLLEVAADREQVTYRLLEGEPLRIVHDGEPLLVTTGAPVTRPALPVPDLPRPAQPPGREPARRVPRT